MLAFQKRIVLWKHVWRFGKPAQSTLTGFQKFSVQLREICYPTGEDDLNLTVLKAFSKFKSFGAKRFRTYKFIIKVKEKFKIIMNICRTLSLQRPIQPYHLNRILISFRSTFKYKNCRQSSGTYFFPK